MVAQRALSRSALTCPYAHKPDGVDQPAVGIRPHWVMFDESSNNRTFSALFGTASLREVDATVANRPRETMTGSA